MVGDGYCNDETNNIHCDFDGGDCCYSCVSTLFCTDCKCLTGNPEKEINHLLIGDGFCHDEINTADCHYDGGDCYGFCVLTEWLLKDGLTNVRRSFLTLQHFLGKNQNKQSKQRSFEHMNIIHGK